jgi:hypothetical protein
MNHTCMGDIFKRWGKTWGRCFGDSTMFELREGMEFCPACKRPWEGMENRQDFWPDLSTDVILHIDVPQLKFMLEEKDRKIKKLEGDLELWKKMYYDASGIPRVQG